MVNEISGRGRKKCQDLSHNHTHRRIACAIILLPCDDRLNKGGTGVLSPALPSHWASSYLVNYHHLKRVVSWFNEQATPLSPGVSVPGVPPVRSAWPNSSIFKAAFFPLMGRATLRTNSLPFGQPQLLIDIPTDVAAFRRREETFNLVKFCPVPAVFVSELQEQLSPAAVGDPFGQMVIGQHSLHMQVFGIEDLVLVHHPFQEDNPSLTQRPPFIRLFKEAIFCRFLL
jgi:hypothetical protein